MRATKTTTRLADGRELIYYDEKPGLDRSAPDRRDLPRVTTRTELRLDPLVNEWVAVASQRQDRTFLPPADQCPLCPSRGDRLSEIPASEYDVVVFENRFPSLAYTRDVEPYEHWPAILRPGRGRCEVVCFTSDHDQSFANLTPERAELVIEAWADRTTELARVEGVEHIYPFENRGEEIGVTLRHPHGQIYAYPFIPPVVARSLEVARAHHAERGGCLYCDVLAEERATGDRVIVEGKHWTAYVPHAARWPYEAHIVPRRHLPDLPALTEAERADLAVVYLEVLRRFDGLFDTPTPYISAWVQAPVRTDRDLAHLYCKVFTIRRAPGKLKYLAGSESGMGVFASDVAPEQAAERLRAAIPS